MATATITIRDINKGVSVKVEYGDRDTEGGTYAQRMASAFFTWLADQEKQNSHLGEEAANDN